MGHFTARLTTVAREMPGTWFRVTTNGSAFQTIMSFTNAQNGGSPYGGMALGPDGALYGTTQYGGTNSGQGTVFRLTTNGANYTFANLVSSITPTAQIHRGRSSTAAMGFYTAPPLPAARTITAPYSASTPMARSTPWRGSWEPMAPAARRARARSGWRLLWGWLRKLFQFATGLPGHHQWNSDFVFSISRKLRHHGLWQPGGRAGWQYLRRAL